MAPLSMSVPNIRGYDFGVGVDRLSGTVMNQVVNPTPSPPMAGAGGEQSFDVSRIYTSRDLQSALGINIEASYGCASFGAGASGRFAYMQESQVQSSCLFMTVAATLKMADLSIDHAVLTESAQRVPSGRKEVFAARYGDMFCRACTRGGLFVGVMRVETYSSSDASEVEADLRGSYGLFSAEAQTKFKEVAAQHRASVYCWMYAEGGPELSISDPTDPAALLSNANTWKKALSDYPDKFARPYEWTLSPVTIAEGPLPPNPEQIQHAQDILLFCARERTNLLDQLNLLNWMYGHPERFDFSGAVPKEAIRSVARETQNDLDLISRCANAAINSPGDATFPAAFAAAQNPPMVYPSSEMPEPLPQQLPRPTEPTENVVIPNWVSLWMAREGVGPGHPIYSETLSAGDLGLILDVEWVPVSSWEGDGLIHSQDPPAGSLVQKGSTVKLRCGKLGG